MPQQHDPNNIDPRKNSKYFLLQKPIFSLVAICLLLVSVIGALPGIVLAIVYIVEVNNLMKAIRVRGAFDDEKYAAEQSKIQLAATKKLIAEEKEKLAEWEQKTTEAEAKFQKEKTKTEKTVYIFNAIKQCTEHFAMSEMTKSDVSAVDKTIAEMRAMTGEAFLFEPIAEIRLHSADLRDLRQRYKDIQKNIDRAYAAYEARYTAKNNIVIYRLMFSAMRSELQNVLYTMKNGKLDDALAQIKEITSKYVLIASDGDKNIVPTITRFALEIGALFDDAAKVEYEYYLRKERVKEEQKALREQMKQEAEERKALEQQKKQIEKEESKYNAEMEALRAQMESANAERASLLNARIAELEQLLSAVEVNKEKISKLQNGKAGYVYVISNLGSFGENVFKIGMTRRLEPQDRVNELGSASVPFAFDVHSFIFSEDAPALEHAVHQRLNNNRVNKVNLRKEFFNISVDELEELVHELQPSAEFNRTMAAEQYRQSLSMTEAFTDFEGDAEDPEEE